MWKLFIDDERSPVTDDWVVARSSADALYYIRQIGIPNEIAFDHDLGGDDTSMKFLRDLVRYMIDNDLSMPKDFKYSVHSQNPIGANNIHGYMRGILIEFK